MSTQPKFTPGPWKWDESWGAIVIDRLDVQKLICPMWTGSDRRGVGHDVVAEDTANAHLIAAAPDLYAACKSIVSSWESLSDESVNLMLSKDRDSLARSILTIRAALAKAEGGAA